MPESVRYSPIMGEEMAEVPRQNDVSAMCYVMAMVDALAVAIIVTGGLAYWGTCMMLAPLNAWYNVNTNDWGKPIQDKVYWCEHLNYYGYHKNNLTRCVEALQHAEKAESHCWDLGGRIYGLVAFAIFTGVVVANVGYCCGRKIMASR